jgi:chemotaxis signal transduction protein
VLEIVSLRESEVREPPDGVAVRRDYLRGITGEALLILDAEKLLRLHG